jgi:hypothetical protein
MNKNDAREIAQAQRLRDEIAPLAAALHNVSIVGDAHGAVLELLQALDAWTAATDNNDGGGAGVEAWIAASRRLDTARARFHIPSTTQRDNADASEVGA